MMNWKGCERKRSWFNLKYYPAIYPEELRKILEISVMIMDDLAGIQTGHFLKTSQKCYHFCPLDL
jgi:hypothetical protein